MAGGCSPGRMQERLLGQGCRRRTPAKDWKNRFFCSSCRGRGLGEGGKDGQRKEGKDKDTRGLKRGAVTFGFKKQNDTSFAKKSNDQ